MRTLLLDNSYFPVRIIGWQKAMILLVTGRAEMVDAYQDKQIRSVSQSFLLPKILRLFSRHRNNLTVKFTRANVFVRDNYTCQYCAQRFPMKELTFDHVLPVSQGGKTCWENIVTACGLCNTKKGGRTPEQAHMKLLTSPKRPRWSAKLCLKLKEEDPGEWHLWIPGFSKL